jgi:ribosomal protein L10
VRFLAGFKHLRSLTLFHPSRGRADFTGAGFAALATLAEFERMTVAGGTVGDSALQAIATLPHLRELRLWHNSETAAGVRSLAGLVALRKLTLGQRLPGRDARPASLSGESLPAIAEIQTLEELSIQDAHLDYEALAALKKLPHLKKLTASQVDTPAADVDRLRTLLAGVTIDWKPMTEQEAATMRDKLKL